MISQHRASSLISATSGHPGYVDKSVKAGNPAVLLFGFDRDDEKVVQAVVPAATVRLGEVPRYHPQGLDASREEDLLHFISSRHLDPAEFIDSASVGHLDGMR
jgi:hypothetical protein